MRRKYIDCREYADVITKALNPGILLTAKADGKVNPMTIGWGTVGVNWSKPVFAAYVRQSRYTHQLLDANPFFTVNVPYGEYDRSVLGLCGTKSGRDTDKLAEAGLTPVAPEVISVPGLKEWPLTLECRVIYREEQTAARLPEALRRRFYSVEAEDHIAYFGEIVAAYLIED